MAKKSLPVVSFEPFVGCRFCKGRGCIGCKKERKEAEYNSLEAIAAREAEANEYLNKHLLFSARRDNPEEMAKLADVFRMDKLKAAFDSSDISDEEVLHSIGQGSIEQAERDIEKACRLAAQLSPQSPTKDEMRDIFIKKRREELASYRAIERITESLSSDEAV